MENLTYGQFAVALASIVGVCSALAYFLKPAATLLVRLRKVEEHQDNDLKRLEKMDEDLRQVLLSINVLLSHNIDGNHTEQLKIRQQEMNDYLINNRR